MVLAIVSAIVVLLAGVPLFQALRSTGPRWLALALLIPLGLGAVFQLLEVRAYCLLPISNMNISFFYLDVLALGDVARVLWLDLRGADSFRIENLMTINVVRWTSVLVTTLWLTCAQVASWRRRESRA